MKGDRENQTWECQYLADLMISSKEHSQQEKTAVFQELLHQGILLGKPQRNIADSTFQVVFFQLVLHADLPALCNQVSQKSYLIAEGKIFAELVCLVMRLQYVCKSLLGEKASCIWHLHIKTIQKHPKNINLLVFQPRSTWNNQTTLSIYKKITGRVKWSMGAMISQRLCSFSFGSK